MASRSTATEAWDALMTCSWRVPPRIGASSAWKKGGRHVGKVALLSSGDACAFGWKAPSLYAAAPSPKSSSKSKNRRKSYWPGEDQNAGALIPPSCNASTAKMEMGKVKHSKKKREGRPRQLGSRASRRRGPCGWHGRPSQRRGSGGRRRGRGRRGRRRRRRGRTGRAGRRRRARRCRRRRRRRARP